VPADHKWFTRVVVAAAIVDGLAGLKLSYPKISASQSREIAEAKKTPRKSMNERRANSLPIV
jgi:hypothetical protein